MALLTAGVSCMTLPLSSCCRCHCFPDEPDKPSEGIYPLEILTSYDDEWFLPVSPRAADTLHAEDLPLRELRPPLPTGVRAVVYYSDGTSQRENLSPEGGVINTREGVHDVLLYSNDSEYIVLYNQSDFSKTVATTRDIPSESIKGEGAEPTGKSLATVNQPDMLFSSSYEDCVVSPDSPFNYIESTLSPKVFSYVIRVKVNEGLEYISHARGALSGMAAGVFLHNGHTTSECVDINFDCTIEDGHIQGIVRSFGIPDFPSEESSFVLDYRLILEMRLINGKSKRMTVNISPQLNFQPQGGVIWIDGVMVTPGEGGTSGGGFDVSVGDWNQGEDIDIMF